MLYIANSCILHLYYIKFDRHIKLEDYYKMFKNSIRINSQNVIMSGVKTLKCYTSSKWGWVRMSGNV